MAYTLYNPAAGNVFWNTSGAAITAQPKVDGGAAAGLGSDQTNLDNVSNARYRDDLYGAIVVQGASSGNGVSAELPKTSGDFATMTAGRYIMRCGGANTEYLAGSADTTLRSGASDYGYRKDVGRSIIRDALIATAIRNNQWVAVSGTWSTSPTADTNGLGDVAGLATSGTDQAVTPTGYIPGELVYSLGSTPVYADYKARTTR